MKWKVYYTESAVEDLRDIHDYIANVLVEPVIANNQIRRIMDMSDSLDEQPFRYRVYDKEPWHSMGWRVLPVDKYLVFYLPDESKNTVQIIRIIYGGRDIENHLNDFNNYLIVPDEQ